MTLTLTEAAQNINGLLKYAEVTLRDWRWNARKGDHSLANLKRLRVRHEEANAAVSEALAVISAGEDPDAAKTAVEEEAMAYYTARDPGFDAAGDD